MSYYKLNDGKELYYEEIGEGTPVVFLHGWSSSHEIFSLFSPELEG